MFSDIRISTFTSDKPLYIQLAQEIQRMIDAGDLVSGQSIPATRELAAALNVSRDTVVNAYKELQRLGYIGGTAARGSYVLPRQESNKPKVPEELSLEKISSLGRAAMLNSFDHPASPCFAALNYGAIPRDLLPVRKWRTSMQKYCESEKLAIIDYEPDVFGRKELRSALAEYLARCKGIECKWQQIAIFSVASGLINLLCRLLLDPNDAIAVEEPGYGAIKNIARGHSLAIVPVSVDHDGMVVHELEKSSAAIKMIYVTSNHHDPTGKIMSLNRRQNLIEWANQHDALIIDDDYDGNFYYGKLPPKSLWSLASTDNIIYSSTFWQVLYPLTTVGFAVLPERIMSLLYAAKELQTVSMTDIMIQLTLCELLTSGTLEVHTKQTRKLFAQRRINCIQLLTLSFGKQIEIDRAGGGTTLTVRFPGYQEDALTEAAQKAGFPMVSTTSYYAKAPVKNEFLINFSLYPEDQLKIRLNSFVSSLLRHEQ